MNEILSHEDWISYQGEYPVSMKHGISLFLRPGCAYSEKRFLYKIAEKNEIDFLEKYSFQNMICMDVGANVGYYTAWLLKKKAKFVYAFEPDPVTFEILQKNTKNRKDVLGVCAAVGQFSGELNLYVDDKHSGDNRTKYTAMRNFIKVPAISIDTYFAENRLEKIDFIKIDVQGAETAVLNGASESIEEFKPMILIEVSPEAVDVDREELINFLSEWMLKMNFKSYAIEEGKLVNLTCKQLKHFNGNLIVNPEHLNFL